MSPKEDLVAQEEVAKHREELGGVIPVLLDESNAVFKFPAEKFEELVASGEYESVKIMHFVRHGQGFHNQRALDVGYGCQCDSKNPQGPCPYKSKEILDAQLTDQGKKEAQKVYAYMAEHEEIIIEHVLTSPLSRAIGTGLIGLADEKFKSTTRECLENLREQYGSHVCDKRHTKSWLESTYSSVDFSNLKTEEDPWFTEERESKKNLAERIVKFLRYAKELPATRIAVFTHSAFLFTMSGEWFQTGELRSFAIAFRK